MCLLSRERWEIALEMSANVSTQFLVDLVRVHFSIDRISRDFFHIQSVIDGTLSTDGSTTAICRLTDTTKPSELPGEQRWRRHHTVGGKWHQQNEGELCRAAAALLLRQINQFVVFAQFSFSKRLSNLHMYENWSRVPI